MISCSNETSPTLTFSVDLSTFSIRLKCEHNKMKPGSSNQLKSGNPNNLKGPSSKSRNIQKKQKQNKGFANNSPGGRRRRRRNKYNKNNIKSEREARNFGSLKFKQTQQPSSNASNRKGKCKGKGKKSGEMGNQKVYHGQVQHPQQPEHYTVLQGVNCEEKPSIPVLPISDNFPKELLPYWEKRYELFSLYDLGIKLDLESWYSVTPEKIAQAIAQYCFQRNKGTVLDVFCGCGGNAIQFAKYFTKVIAIDIDPKKVEYARHNATIYGVHDKIVFMSGDSTEIVPLLKKVDIVFLSPPWGGPGYRKQKVFDIERGIQLKSATGTGGMNGIELFYWAQSITPTIAYFLPKNVDQNQVKALAEPCKLQFNYVRRSKRQGLTAYFGDLAVDSAEEPLQV